MMQKRRVVVTGIGVVSAFGHGVEKLKRGIIEGFSGIRYIPELEELKFSCLVGGRPNDITEELLLQYFTSDELPAVNEAMGYGAIACIDAFRDAGLKVPDRTEDLLYEDTGAIIGTGIGGMDTIANKVCPNVSVGKVRRLGSTVVEQVMGSAVSARIGGILGLGNQVTTNSSACSTGTEAIIMGANRIQMGLANRMVVGGAEGSSPYSWAGFDSMRVLCKNFNEHPEKASRPMSASAAGFVPSSGAGILILEEYETAMARNAKIYGEIIGSSINCGGMRFGGTMTAPSSTSVKRCIRSAVLEASIKPTEIDYINGHLTATYADTVEIPNWSEALELAPDAIPYINSTKSMLGHSLGATGAIECIATLLQMQGSFIHGSINCEDLHEKLEPFKSRIIKNTFMKEIRVAAKASFGFGDVNSCVIFKK